jgi:hypothetical protein
MKLLARYIEFGYVRANNIRMFLRLAFPQSHVSIGQQDYQYVEIIMKTFIDGSRC